MKKVMRPRYYCEFCNKGSGSGGHMKTHESRCTKNPARKCNMCTVLLGQSQPDLAMLIALLPTIETQMKIRHNDYGANTYEDWLPVPPETVKALREAAGGCPACMMAALRQRGIPVPTAEGFDFTKESKQILSDYNETQTIDYAHEY